MSERRGEFAASHSWYADRILFVERSKALCPKLWEDLKADVLPVFRTHRSDFDEARIRAFKTHASYRALGLPLFEWAEKYHAESIEWLVLTAVRTLFTWCDHPSSAESLWVNLGASMEFTPEFQPPPWDKNLETRPAYNRRIAAKTLELDRQLIQAGSGRTVSEMHIDWLILYQFRGLSPAKIRSTMKIERNITTIQDGIEKAGKHFGVRLRQPNRGPRKRN